MKVATWEQFITTHPDTEELSNAAASLHLLIDPDDTLDTNLDRICASESIVIITNDALNRNPLPVFFHHRIGLPIPGVTKRLVGMTGFDSRAHPVVLESERLCALTANEIATPSLRDFLQEASKGLDELKLIQTSANENHKIRLAAILFPQLAAKVTALQSVSAWDLLFTAIKEVQKLKPIVVQDEDTEEADTGADDDLTDIEYAKDFLPLLITLWSFTNSTEATKAITPPQHSSTMDRKINKWCRDLHDKHIALPARDTTNPQPVKG